jgi:hypothetical protein
MKCVFYVAAYHKPYQFHWLYSAISNDADLLLLHVDRNAPEDIRAKYSAIASGRSNVIELPGRPVVWGGWSQVSAELAAIRFALQADRNWKYFINLSGQDYPIQSLATIRQVLADAWPRSFIRVWPFERVRTTEPDDPHLRGKVVIELFGRIRWLPFRLPKLGDARYKGSSWHMLTRDFCRWLVLDPVPRRLANHLRFSFAPDEVFSRRRS